MDWVKINNEGELEFVADEVKLVPEVQALLSPKYNKKGRAMQELKYMFLAYSPKSPYKDYNEKERILEAKADCGYDTSWEESDELKKLVPKFKRGNQSRVARLLETVERFIDKFENHLNDLNLNERNSTNGLVHSPKSVMETLERLPRLAETLQELESQARSGIITKVTSKGDHELGLLGTGNIKLPTKVKKDESGEDESEEQ